MNWTWTNMKQYESYWTENHFILNQYDSIWTKMIQYELIQQWHVMNLYAWKMFERPFFLIPSSISDSNSAWDWRALRCRCPCRGSAVPLPRTILSSAWYGTVWNQLRTACRRALKGATPVEFKSVHFAWHWFMSEFAIKNWRSILIPKFNLWFTLVHDFKFNS